MIDLNDGSFQVLLVPPWENASSEHWMSVWQRKYPRFLRVEQRDWMNPNRQEWVEKLDEFIRAQTKPVVLVSHSLGSLTVAHWAGKFKREIKGAFLAAPPDVEQADTPEEIKSFAPVPLEKLDFPSILIASENDNYAVIGRSKFFAESWGSRFVNIGAAGHLNPKAGFGEWIEGEKLLSKFIAEIFKKFQL